MMPSRGRLIRHAAASFKDSSCRQLSTRAQNSSPFLRSRAQPTSSLLTSKPLWQGAGTGRPAALVTPSIAIRLQSTSATSSASTAESTAVLAHTPANDSAASLSNISDLATSDYANIPERIGYLKELGLDYGWGPTATMEWLLEHVHIYTGTPWWASIMLTAVIVRLVLFKPYINLSDLTARMQALKPVLEPIQERMKVARASNDNIAAMQVRDELIRAYKLGGIKLYRSFVPIFAQMFLGFGVFRLMRGMASLPVPGLENGGLLWLKDLTIADPYLILPLAMGGILHLLGKKGGEAGSAAPMTPFMRNIVLYGLPVIFTATMLPMPAALQLSFVASTSLGILQSYVLRQPAIRQWLGIAPLVAPGSAEPSTKQPKSRLTYQAPTIESSIAGSGKEPLDTPPAKKGLLASAKSEVQGVMKEAQKSLNNLRGAEQGKKGGPSKAFLKRAEDYERRRLRELEEERWEMEEARRLKREQRRQGR